MALCEDVASGVMIGLAGCLIQVKGFSVLDEEEILGFLLGSAEVRQPIAVPVQASL